MTGVPAARVVTDKNKTIENKQILPKNLDAFTDGNKTVINSLSNNTTQMREIY